MDTARLTREIRELPQFVNGRSYISYDEDIPAAFAREMGAQGMKVDDAFEGHYRYAPDWENQVAGRMPGTVFKITDEVRAAAMKPKSYFQRQPDWDALPKGATELLTPEGRTRVHLFEQADPSTWIHELGHVALYDLAPEDLAVIEQHLGGGKRLADWGDMEHESFARAFEQYVRTGRAPTKALRATFRKMAEWIKQVWKAEKRKGTPMHEDIEEVFGRMFRAPESQDVWGYFPHRDLMAQAQQEYRGGVRPPAAGQTIGVPRLTQQTVQRKGNELQLFQSGRLSGDPSHLVDVFLKRMRFQETLNARDELWAVGQPLSEGPAPKGAWLIRNPDATATTIPESVQATVRGRDPNMPLDEKALESIEGHLYGDAENVRQEMIANPSENPGWAGDVENVRWVPGSYVERRFGEVFEQRPRGNMWSALGILNSLQRITGIYGRPFAYVAGNIPFNVMALMSSMPVSTLRNAGRGIRIGKEDPALYRAIASETGETRAAAGLPEFYVGAQNRLQGAERRVTQTQRGMADVLSRGADTPFRVVAFLNNAAKRGYKTQDELWELIRDNGSDLGDIRQMTREQLLDFDALNPAQRRMASNLLYLWPFIYASMKWPAMFAREYPVRATAASQLAREHSEDAPQAIADLWQKYGVDLGTLNPLSVQGDVAEQLQLLVQNPQEMNLEVVRERLSPTLAAGAEWLTGGSKNALPNFLRQTIPGAAEVYSADPAFRGGKQYEDQSRGGYLGQRYFRFWPRGINEEVVRERVEKYHQDRTTQDTHELERDADWEKLASYYNKVGGDAEEIRRSYKAWWDYQEAVAERKESSGQRKLTTYQTIEILDEVARDQFPELTPYLWDLSRMDDEYQEKYAEQLDAYMKALKDRINQGRTQLFNDYRSYASE